MDGRAWIFRFIVGRRTRICIFLYFITFHDTIDLRAIDLGHPVPPAALTSRRCLNHRFPISLIFIDQMAQDLTLVRAR